MNRFPKMAYLQYARACQLDYPVWQAKAIGMAEAKKYAMFKNARYVPVPRNKKTSSRKSLLYLLYKENPHFKLFVDNEGYPVVGKQRVTDEDFDKYMKRFDFRTIRRLEAWAFSIVKPLRREILENESKFFNHVWKPHRDDEI